MATDRCTSLLFGSGLAWVWILHIGRTTYSLTNASMLMLPHFENGKYSPLFEIHKGKNAVHPTYKTIQNITHVKSSISPITATATPRRRPSKWHAWLRRGLLLQQRLKSTELSLDLGIEKNLHREDNNCYILSETQRSKEPVRCQGYISMESSLRHIKIIQNPKQYVWICLSPIVKNTEHASCIIETKSKLLIAAWASVTIFESFIPQLSAESIFALFLRASLSEFLVGQVCGLYTVPFRHLAWFFASTSQESIWRLFLDQIAETSPHHLE